MLFVPRNKPGDETTLPRTFLSISDLCGDWCSTIMAAVSLRKTSQSHSGMAWSSENGYLQYTHIIQHVHRAVQENQNVEGYDGKQE